MTKWYYYSLIYIVVTALFVLKTTINNGYTQTHLIYQLDSHYVPEELGVKRNNVPNWWHVKLV